MKYQINNHGQAILEMCIGLIGMLSVIMAIMFISSVSIANIKTLFSSRTNAESNILHADADSFTARSDIYAWHYDQESIPFTPRDRVSYYTINGLQDVNDAISSAGYSQAETQGYEFKSLRDIEMRSQRSYSTEMMLFYMDSYATAANLVVGNPDSFSNLYIHRNSSAEERENLAKAISNWLGVDVNSFKASLQRSNQVFLPKLSSTYEYSNNVITGD